MALMDIGDEGIVGTPGVPMTTPTPVGCWPLQQLSSRAAFKLQGAAKPLARTCNLSHQTAHFQVNKDSSPPPPPTWTI